MAAVDASLDAEKKEDPVEEEEQGNSLDVTPKLDNVLLFVYNPMSFV